MKENNRNPTIRNNNKRNVNIKHFFKYWKHFSNMSASQALIKFLREKTNKAMWSHVVIGGDLNMNEVEFATLLC
jgi:hypothetical protein